MNANRMSNVRMRSWRLGGLVLGLIGLSASTTLAGDRHRIERPDVDIDTLKAELFRGPTSATLSVRYEVEIEDCWRPDGFVLVVTPADRRGVLIDEEGRPFDFAIPLDRPTDIDDDEAEFEGQVRIELPREVGWLHDLRLQAAVVRGGAVFDRDDTRIKVREIRVRGCDVRTGVDVRTRSWGGHVGVSVYVED